LPIILNFRDVSRIVLIDDDKYICRSWEANSKRRNIDFIYFTSVNDLLNNLSSLKITDDIFIDQNIGKENGIELANKLFNKGFIKLFLATGYDKKTIELPGYIIDVFGKEFPFS